MVDLVHEGELLYDWLKGPTSLPHTTRIHLKPEWYGKLAVYCAEAGPGPFVATPETRPQIFGVLIIMDSDLDVIARVI